jgi:hypothetical protein
MEKYALRNRVMSMNATPKSLTPKLLASQSCLEYYLSHSKHVKPVHYMELAKIYHVSANRSQALELFEIGLSMHKESVITVDNLSDRVEFYETYGSFLEKLQPSKAFPLYLQAYKYLNMFQRSVEITWQANILSSAFELAKLNVAFLARELELHGKFEFDENYTCVLPIADEFSMHLTFEPNSNRLYLYSPLLDGLPAQPDVLAKLYETLLEGSMRGIIRFD